MEDEGNKTKQAAEANAAFHIIPEIPLSVVNLPTRRPPVKPNPLPYFTHKKWKPDAFQHLHWRVELGMATFVMIPTKRDIPVILLLAAPRRRKSGGYFGKRRECPPHLFVSTNILVTGERIFPHKHEGRFPDSVILFQVPNVIIGLLSCEQNTSLCSRIRKRDPDFKTLN